MLEAFPFEAPSMMFSRTVRPGKTRRPSGTCATPSLTIDRGLGPRSVAVKQDRAGARRNKAEIARSVVDLPAPLEPSSATTAPSSIVNETPPNASISPKLTPRS